MDLQNKIAVITGASRGIGKAVALEMARAGAVVVVAARSDREGPHGSGSIHQTAAEIKAVGGQAHPLQTDISDERQVASLFYETVARFQRVDILVNNAATNRPASFCEMPLKHWDLILKVNLRGAVACIQSALPHMMKQQCGHIINLSSVVALQTEHVPFTGIAYDVSKVALNRLTVALARELRPHRIAVNALMPDNTRSEGWMALNPECDTSGWQAPELWGRYAVRVAARNPAAFTGNILSQADMQAMQSP